MVATEVIAELTPRHEMIQLYEQDAYFAPIYSSLTTPEYANPEDVEKAKNYRLVDYWLCYKDGEQLAIPDNKNLKLKILQEVHSTPTSGHLGVEKTYEQASRHFYWPRMSKEVKKFVTSCDECQRNKSSNWQPAGLLWSLIIPNERWKQITI